MYALGRSLKRILASFVALLASGTCVAAEYGVGISAKSDNGLIYIPVELTPTFRIEPYIRHSSSDSKQTIDFGATETTFRSNFEQLEGGLGMFGLAVPKESVRLYFGGRASYFDSDTRSSTSALQFKQSVYGYRIIPTMGFEYLFNGHFTLGGEVGYYFEHRNVDERSVSSHRESESDQNGTESFLILRYFF
jgi:hypothetical protein